MAERGRVEAGFPINLPFISADGPTVLTLDPKGAKPKDGAMHGHSHTKHA